MSEKNHDFGSLVCIYSQILPKIRAVAKTMGYAVAIHGTMQRDLDLLAVPWVENAVEPIALVKAFADIVDGYVIGDTADNRGGLSERPTQQPHGRLSWNIIWGGKAFVDLSVMPLKQSDASQAETK